MTRYLIVAILAIVSPPQSETKDSSEEAFSKIWEATKKAPQKADYQAIRASYIKTSSYQPYSVLSKETEAVNKAMRAKDYPNAIAAINRVLEKKPLEIESHLMAAFLHSKAGDKTLEEMHKEIAIGLTHAILDGHDGTSFDNAIPVISVDEEYVVLKSLSLKSEGHALRVNKDQKFDVHKINEPGSKQTREIYFDVTQPMDELAKMLKPKK